MKYQTHLSDYLLGFLCCEGGFFKIVSRHFWCFDVKKHGGLKLSFIAEGFT